MPALRFFVDTHDRAHQTFPQQIDKTQFASFYALYEQACEAEGVVPLSLHVGYAEGRAFCMTMAPDADAVRRVHERLGLPFDAITEVSTVTPGDMHLHRP